MAQQKEHILIIEDDDGIRDTLCDLFTFEGYRVACESNGKLGVRKAVDLRPDLIICDIMMPEMDGFQTLKEIQKIKKLDNIPFIFLTAKIGGQNFRKGMNLGADDFLTKPFSNEELLGVVRLRLKKSNRAREVQRDKIQKLMQLIKNQDEKINSYALLNSHDLRGPVARILGLMDLLLKDQIKAEEIRNNNILKMLQATCSELDSIVLEINQMLITERNGKSHTTTNQK